MASDTPKFNVNMVPVIARALVAGSSRPFFERLGEGVGQLLWQAGVPLAPKPRRARAFLTPAQLRRRLRELEARYPHLVQVREIGRSGDTHRGTASRPILAVRIASARAAGRPAVLHVAGVHPNEVANTGTVLAWIELMLAGYGHDAAATAMLDSREFHVIPLANPDGAARVADGYRKKPGGDLRRRKNTSPPSGVNLNRNYPYKWRSDGGSPDPTHRDYAGPTAGSEAETQAVMGYINSVRPRMIVDWHSFGQMVLWPWGYTTDETPDGAGFEAMGRNIAAINGYHAMKGSKLYPTGGSVGDWAYATHHAAVITVETGLWFHQGDRERRDNLSRNLGVFDYVAGIAADPFRLAQGPRPTHAGGGVIALADPDGVAAAELVTDPDAPAGSGTPLSSLRGQFGKSTERVFLPSAAAGAWIRARDTQGNWGAAMPVPGAVTATTPTSVTMRRRKVRPARSVR